MTATWKVHVRDELFARAGELDTFSLDAVLRFNDVSTWTLTIPAGIAQAGLFVLAKGGIIVTRNDAIVFSGPTQQIERRPDTWVVSGDDDTSLLRDHRALPVLTGAAYTTAEYDVRTGPAETVLRQFVEVNFGPTAARPERRSFGLASATAGDTGLGTTVSVKARFDNMLALAREIALGGGGLRFRIAQSTADADTVDLLVNQARDLRDDAVFSLELGNLADYRDVHSSPAYNAIIAAGQGQATARVFVERQDAVSLSLYGRREWFYDRRAAVDTTELAEYAETFLDEHAEVRSTTITPIDTESVAFLDHYGLGDLVTVVVEGEAITGVVREVDLSIDQDGATFQPTIGTHRAGLDPLAVRHLAALEQRVSNIERNSRIPAGGVTTALMAGGSVTRSVIDPVSHLPVGMFAPYGGGVIPTGWLYCDGTVKSQTTYGLLFAAIGSTWNTGGEGAGNFRIPDGRNRFLLGANNTTRNLGNSGGNETYDLSHAHAMNHGHTTNSPVGDVTDNLKTVTPEEADASAKSHVHVVPTSSGLNTSNGLTAPLTITPPYLAVHWMIYAGV